MIGESYTMSYLNYVILLCLLSGILILVIDVRSFEIAGLNKERKVSKYLGWFSILIGSILFMAEIILQ
ncbi:CLC_0170 family protein [Paenibacillus sp. 2TAB23]|uniref:CLC_0170 family protein n=1 Tax=Paenibacillus sp. 2TAB23 TaxID=3233004 RepID=UPI003F94D074